MKIKIFVCLLVAALAVYVTIGIVNDMKIEKVYKQAVTYMQAAEYEAAIEQLILVNDGKIKKTDYLLYGSHAEIAKISYKDSATLLAYALAKVSYEAGKDMNHTACFVDFISDGYNQTLSDEIIAFKQVFETEYGVYQYEKSKKRAAEEERLNKSAPNSGKNNRSAYKPSSGSGVKNGSGKEPYGINDYDTPEDFYESNRDEFWDYDEAQRYYNRYHENP
ncbi:MAG: hypothetical protein IJD83_02235 [Clostridia bacterium]|nr:hypothetical protein [Clostridia bacterium]